MLNNGKQLAHRKHVFKIAFFTTALLWLSLSTPFLDFVSEHAYNIWLGNTARKVQETIQALQNDIQAGNISTQYYEQLGLECQLSDTLWIGTFDILCTDSIITHPSGTYLCVPVTDTLTCAVRIISNHRHLPQINKPLPIWKVGFNDGFSFEQDDTILPIVQLILSFLLSLFTLKLFPQRFKPVSIILFIALFFIGVNRTGILFSSAIYGISIITPSPAIIITLLLTLILWIIIFMNSHNKLLRFITVLFVGYSLYVTIEIVTYYPYFPVFAQLPLMKGSPLIVMMTWLLAISVFIFGLRQTIRFAGINYIILLPFAVAVYSTIANTLTNMLTGLTITLLLSAMFIFWYKGFRARRWFTSMLSGSLLISLPFSIYITIMLKEHVSKQLKWLAEESIQWRDPLIEYALLNNEPIESFDFISNEFLIDSTERDILLMGSTQITDNLWFRWRPFELSISYIYIGDTIGGLLKVKILKKFLSPFSPFNALLDYHHSLPLPDLSIALYERDTLLIAKGSYPYSYVLQPHISHGNWLHEQVSTNNTTLVFSLPFIPIKETFQWFIFITLLSMIVWNLRKWRLPASIHRRFALGFIGATTVLFGIIGVLLLGFFDEEQRELQEMEVRRWLEVGSHQLIYDAPESLSFTLSDADIAIFNLSGWLSYTSQPVPFLRGLKGFRMPYHIWKKLYSGNPYSILIEGNMSGTSFVEGYRRSMCGNEPCFLWLPSYGLKLLWAKEVSWWFVVIATLFILSLIISYYASRWLAISLLRPIHKIRTALLEYGKGHTPEVNTSEISPELRPVANAIKTMIEQRKKWHEQQVQIQRLKGWQALARQAVHEIRNLLTPMKLLLQKNMLKYRQNQEIYSDFQKLHKHIERMEKLSNDFSSLSRLSRPDLQPVPIHHWLNEFMHTNPFPVEISISVESATVIANSEALSIIMRNTLKNAIEADATQITIEGRKVNNQYVLKIKDNGIGMDSKTLENIFVPEFTSKSSGMGVGMAIVKHLINSMKGDIEVFSTKGQGTTVVIYLPLQTPFA